MKIERKTAAATALVALVIPLAAGMSACGNDPARDAFESQKQKLQDQADEAIRKQTEQAQEQAQEALDQAKEQTSNATDQAREQMNDSIPVDPSR